MGMIPVLWTSTPSGATFDTNGSYPFLHAATKYLTDGLSDWTVASGAIPGTQSVLSFDHILNNATLINTGYIIIIYFCLPKKKRFNEFSLASSSWNMTCLKLLSILLLAIH